MIIESCFTFRDEVADRARMGEVNWMLAQYMSFHGPVMRCREVAVITLKARDYSMDYWSSHSGRWTRNIIRTIMVSWGL